MKRLIMALALITSVSTVSLKADKLVDAIKAGKLKRVEQLLAEHRHLDHCYKKELAKVAHKATKHAQKATESLSKSDADALRLLIGLAVTVGGGCFVVSGLRDWTQPKRSLADNLGDVGVGLAKIFGGSAVALYSAKQAYQGWAMSIARSRLEKANAIELLIAEKETHHH
jgi:glutamine synthetase type III